MLAPVTLRQTALVLALLAITSQAASCRCQSEGLASDLPGAAWSTTAPVQVVDDSLSETEYTARGLPTCNHHWTGEDMREAAAHLRTISATNPRSLPRHRSARSGKVLARITASENLSVLHNPSVPVALRLPSAVAYTHELNAIYELYAAALHAKNVTGDDLAELHAARLRACETMLGLTEEFLPTLAKTDPKYQIRLAGIDAMRNGTTDAMLAALRALSEPLFFGLPARKRLVAASRETFPAIASRLPVAKRELLLEELKALAAQPSLSNLHPELGLLEAEMSTAVAPPPSDALGSGSGAFR